MNFLVPCFPKCALATILTCIFATAIFADESVQIFPETIELSGKSSWQTLTLQSMHRVQAGSIGSLPDIESDSFEIGSQITTNIQWDTSDAAICTVDPSGKVVAMGDGEAVVSAKVRLDDGTVAAASREVKVNGTENPTRWEFENHVQSVLARAGCNMGACHGALAGKGGFRLSLRGYDSATDYFNITQQNAGRRVEFADPELSLLLLKPSGRVAHKGGMKLPEDSHNYRVLLEWILQGGDGPSRTEELASGEKERMPPTLERVVVSPNRILTKKGQSQQLVVQAFYSNGRIEDVTHWAKFTATDESVAMVNEDGKVTVVGPGEGAVSVWFASRIMMARVTVPFEQSVPPSAYDAFGVANSIDQAVLDQLVQLNLAPSERCTDREFIRRAFLDTIGKLPSPEEVAAFVDQPDSNKRGKLVDHLLSREEFVDYWTYQYSDLLMLNGNLLRPDAIKSYYDWIRNHVANNTAWDVMVREVLTATGESMENGATNFYALHQDPESMTENACQAFLSLSIGCAKCHNHPLEKWTNDQYYAMANMFARVRGKGWGGDSRNGDGKRTLVVLDQGDLIQPITGKPQPPAPLDSPPLDPDSTEDRRVYLAEWMTAKDNPYFAASIANRVWANFFGKGVINPIDDLRLSNPPVNEALMEALRVHLVDHHFDLKSLMRLILNSETYQRSSQAIEQNLGDEKYFSRYYPKRLMAEVMHDAIVQVTGVPTTFDKIVFTGADVRDTDFYPEGTGALELYDSAVDSYFLKTFGRHQRRITCTCERSDEPSVVQVLHLSNGDTVNEKLAHESSIVKRLLEKHGSDFASLVEDAFTTALCRPPTETEKEGLVSELSATPSEEVQLAVEDLLWSLMTSREFLYNH